MDADTAVNHYAENYRAAAAGKALSDQQRGLVIAAISRKMLEDDAFFYAIKAYAESAVSDLYGTGRVAETDQFR